MESGALLESFDKNGTLGELSGRSDGELDAFFRRAAQQARQELDRARSVVYDGSREIRLDSAALSGVNGGEWLVVASAGARRELASFPGAEEIILGPIPKTEPCISLEEARPLLARAAYNGLWSPSGTNWQPVRAVEISAGEGEDLFGRPGCGLLVLSRARYDSILGELAAIAGRQPAAGAEHIDPGIWLEAARLTARGHGWEFEEIGLSREREPRLRKIVSLLDGRVSGSQGRPAALAAELRQMLSGGELMPVAFLLARRGRPLAFDRRAPGNLTPSEMDRLVESRSTQRVASPKGELEKAALQRIFEQARENIPGRLAARLSLHHWKERVPEAVGRAMKMGLEGEGGLLPALELENLRVYLRRSNRLSAELSAWLELPAGEAARRADAVELEAACLPAHLAARLCQGGGYREEGGRLVDRRGRALTPERLLRLVALMARGFGKFFLSFQNTHPLLGVLLLERPSAGELLELGRLAERMTLLSRARGLVSIIKSGPLEIAGAEIRKILDGAGAPPGRPALCFQLGLPLGPDELVSAGTPAEHDGIQERVLDRRAGRARLSQHYLPAPER